MVPNSFFDCAVSLMVPIALSACSVVPTVQYIKIENSKHTTRISNSFYLARSQITIDKIAESEDKAKNTRFDEYSISSSPVAHDAYKIGIYPDNSLRVSTTINLVKIENTDLVSSIGVETTDNTASAINAAGGAITKIVSFLGVLAPPPGKRHCIGPNDYPVRLQITAGDLFAAATAKKVNFDADGKPDQNGCINLDVGDVPKDAIPAAELPFNTSTTSYYYSACREAIVSFTNENIVTKKVRIADPNYVQFVNFPYKGSVSMHSECGVSVKTEANAPRDTAIGIVDALAAQGKAIKDAIDAAKK